MTCWDYDDFYYQEAFARYYGAEQTLRYVDKQANTSAASTMAGGREWFRYDALGRRVVRRFLGDGVCVAYDGGWCVEWDYPEELVRYVWDGDQILYEIRARGGDADPMEKDLVSERKFGRVVYVHGPALDRPLVVERADDWWMQMFLHPDWRGRITAGSWPAGWNDATVGCTETGCDPTVPFVDWAAMRTSSYGDRLTKFREMDGIHRAWLGSFLGWQRDGTEQVYLRNRYNDPVSGRFTQEDPIGLAGGLNFYGFANGDPINFSDPYGLKTCPPQCGRIHAVSAAAGSVVGAVVGAAGGAVAGTVVLPVAGTLGGGAAGE